ncbi:TspO/MBR family protein [Paradevosia shaoguanensis]|uniref:Tryptophan-rich sensory protein n=1 Tax=Paradevosia shaoguanensis TaxID=1335043 RepID=A0AA41QL11_9HYPH|nr:TspO/MBR family protein [Paradevosia shaoguanensis]MCF1742076.1 tryptophan-rich sensory protein [Paradevosia shaoguanensis]MCI0126559.1 tryptophan-rich sensory protein [Paradevosia shaoguanensis]
MNSLVTDYRSPRSIVTLVAFLVVVIGVGALIGIGTAPGEWYAGLNKPPFNPPNWLFGPVWFALYVLIAIAGWRTYMRDSSSSEMKVWYGQMVLNWLWSPVWFALHLLWPAFVVIVAIWALIVAFILLTRRADPVSAWLFAPYLAWVSFASLLNLTIAVLN